MEWRESGKVAGSNGGAVQLYDSKAWRFIICRILYVGCCTVVPDGWSSRALGRGAPWAGVCVVRAGVYVLWEGVYVVRAGAYVAWKGV